MATAIFTEVVARVDQQLTNAIYEDQIRSNINQLAGAHKSLLTNGGFEVWQRGAGAFTTTGVFTADRWSLTITGGTASVTQETSVVDGGSASSLKIVTTGSSDILVVQKIEHVVQMRGRTLAVSARIRQSVASGVVLQIDDSAGNNTSATSATTGSFVTFTTTRAIGAAEAGPLTVIFRFTVAGTYYLDNVMLVIGPAPAPYQPLHPQEELARCQRYYEVHGGVSPGMSFAGYNAAGQSSGQIVPFAVHKYGTPTVTKNGTWAVNNCGQPSVSAPSISAYTLAAVTTALGAMGFNSNSSDDTITAEINP